MTGACSDCENGLGWAVRFKSKRDGRVRHVDLETQADAIDVAAQLMYRATPPEWVEIHVPCDAHVR